MHSQQMFNECIAETGLKNSPLRLKFSSVISKRTHCVNKALIRRFENFLLKCGV